jgi:uncharacterized protein (TIGR03382 family)
MLNSNSAKLIVGLRRLGFPDPSQNTGNSWVEWWPAVETLLLAEFRAACQQWNSPGWLVLGLLWFLWLFRANRRRGKSACPVWN